MDLKQNIHLTAEKANELQQYTWLRPFFIQNQQIIFMWVVWISEIYNKCNGYSGKRLSRDKGLGKKKRWRQSSHQNVREK